MSSADDSGAVLVTGAGRGLGAELVRLLTAGRRRVLATARDSEAFAAVGLAGDITWIALDLADRQSIHKCAAQIGAEDISLVIHNAAIRGDTGGLKSFDLGDFLEAMTVNVAAPLLLTALLVDRLRRDAKIAFISSRAGSMAEGHDPDGDYAYCCSKAALNRAVVKLADDHPQTMLALHPGWLRTDMGGQDATVDPVVAARGLLDVIAQSGPEQSGSFRTYLGEPVAW